MTCVDDMNDADIDDDLSTEDEESMTRMERFPAKSSLVATTKKDVTVKKGRPTVGKKRKRRKQKPKDYPKRPLSAYNIFFKETRGKILTEHGKTNFQDMVRKIAALWKEITPEDKTKFDAIASKDLNRYKEEVGVYERNMVEKIRLEEESRSEIEKLVKKDVSQQFAANNEKMVTAASDPPSVAIDAKTDHENRDDGSRTATPSRTLSSFPVQNVRIPNMAQDTTISGTGQGFPDNIHSNHTLTSNELQLAHHRLEEELVAIEETQALRKRQLEMSRMNPGSGTLSTGMYGGRDLVGSNITSAELEFQRRNLPRMWDAGGDHTLPSREAEIRKRIALGLDGLGGDPMAIINELEMRKRLAGLGGDIAVTSNEVQLRKLLGLERDPMATTNEKDIIKRLAGLGGDPAAISNGVELRKQLGLAADPITSSNQTELNKRLGGLGEDHMIALKEEELRKHLVREAEMRLVRSGMDDNRADIPYFCASDENDIRKYFGHGRDSMSASNEMAMRKCLGLPTSSGLTENKMAMSSEAKIQNHLSLNGLSGESTGMTACSEAEIRKRLAIEGGPTTASNEAERRKRISMGGVRDHLMAPDAELRNLLAVIQNQDLIAEQLGHSGPRAMGMGIGNVYEQNLLHEERIRQQQELLMARFGGGAPSSLYGGLSSTGLSSLERLGIGVPSSGGLDASGSIGSRTLNHDDTRAALMQSQLSHLGMGGMTTPLEQLTMDELRALSSGRGL